MEVTRGYLAAAYVLGEVRRHGGLVLRVKDGGQWRLQMWNGTNVPTSLKFRLLELQPFVMVLLRKLAAEDVYSQVSPE